MHFRREYVSTLTRRYINMPNWGWSRKLVKYLHPPINNIPGRSKGVRATPQADAAFAEPAKEFLGNASWQGCSLLFSLWQNDSGVSKSRKWSRQWKLEQDANDSLHQPSDTLSLLQSDPGPEPTTAQNVGGGSAATALALGSRKARRVLRGAFSRSEGREDGERMQSQLENLQ